MPNYRLTPDEVTALQQQEAQITELQDAVNQYKRAGLDASALQASLNRIKSVRAGMLKHLAPQGAAIRP